MDGAVPGLPGVEHFRRGTARAESSGKGCSGQQAAGGACHFKADRYPGGHQAGQRVGRAGPGPGRRDRAGVAGPGGRRSGYREIHPSFAGVQIPVGEKGEGPVYIRFGRLAVPVINDKPDYKFELGKGVVLREGKDVTLFATGLEVSETLDAAEKLAKDGIDAKVVNIHTIKPLDEELVIASAKETGKVVTIEEHSVIGGLGSAVCDCLSANAPTKVLKIGVNDVYGESGPATELIKKYGLDSEGIYTKVKEFMA